jgi:hypothetical protein
MRPMLAAESQNLILTHALKEQANERLAAFLEPQAAQSTLTSLCRITARVSRRILYPPIGF